MIQSGKFVSMFKINNKPILGPVITEELRKEIQEIRNICKTKEEKIKQRKDELNYSKKAEDERCSSANSYTISNPVFPVSQLPEVPHDLKADSDKETIDEDAASIVTEVNDELNKTTASSLPEDSRITHSDSLFKPNLKSQMKSLIDRQKEEYLKTMDVLRKKFMNEQQQLFSKVHSTMQNNTSTPLTNTSMALTEDEDFTEFQSSLQPSDKSSSEKTLVSEINIRERAATKINAFVRGYLVRRLMKTIYVQEVMKGIQDTLNFVFSLDQHKMSGSPIQDIMLKTKLFKQLKGDLHKLNDIFHEYSTQDKMRIISADRELRRKHIIEKRKGYINHSY